MMKLQNDFLPSRRAYSICVLFVSLLVHALTRHVNLSICHVLRFICVRVEMVHINELEL